VSSPGPAFAFTVLLNRPLLKRFLIADDHGIIRYAIKEILATAFMDAYMEEAADANELLRKSSEGEWDLIITDTVLYKYPRFVYLSTSFQSYTLLMINGRKYSTVASLYYYR